MRNDNPASIEWYRKIRPQYLDLAELLRTLLVELLRTQHLGVLSVTTRTKRLDSVREKLRRKKYENPRQDLTDLCGARIIVYLETEIPAVERLIRYSFRVDDSRSIDKSSVLQPNEVGYRSLHLICSFTPARCELPEYEADKCFHRPQAPSAGLQGAE